MEYTLEQNIWEKTATAPLKIQDEDLKWWSLNYLNTWKKAAVCVWGLLDNNLDIKIYVHLFYTQTSQ